jgi:hypothetical protein
MTSDGDTTILVVAPIQSLFYLYTLSILSTHMYIEASKRSLTPQQRVQLMHMGRLDEDGNEIVEVTQETKTKTKRRSRRGKVISLGNSIHSKLPPLNMSPIQPITAATTTSMTSIANRSSQMDSSAETELVHCVQAYLFISHLRL